MSDIILTVDNFSLNIKNRVVLQNVTFNVERGDYLAIGGIPGSGKSSLIKSMLGLITTGIEGEIAYHNIGKDEVSYIPQNVMQTKEEFPGTAREIVAIGMISRNRGKIMGESDWEKVDELLRDMGLFEVRDKKINKLNTLQQLKVNMAKHMITDPKLLYIDNPSSTLDVKSKINFYETVKRMCDNRQLTVIFITHNIKEISKFANKLLFLRKREKNFYFGDCADFIKEKESKVK
ncbi:ATP-binding cassette domain-containing protein [uncultured Fusobacterium sp.]|uniref:ATP-binding cassette domain-containing protein n=1 Tax=uncultured Fusobacterium sp. TaxID=159267 RepID=UPI0025ECE1FE|nr:ATP-binding cassette domain-containing protein [uncultured Fusobacterium sp.]